MQAEDRLLKKIEKPVKIVSCNFKHNHPLNKQMLIKAKMATKQYRIPPEACYTMLHLIEDGPVHPLHVKNFLKRFYPNSVDISHQMMFNFRLKCKELQQKFGSLQNVPTEQAHAVFDKASLENAPEHWDTNPIYSQVFKQTMQEVLLGSPEEFDGQIAIVKIMEKVKLCRKKGFDYRVFYEEDQHPAGVMYMTPYQIRQFLCYRELLSLDWQLKRKNTYGCVISQSAGTNNNKKLVHFAHSFMIAELLGFANFLLKSICEISGRDINSTTLIAMDGKFDQESFQEAIPGKLQQLRIFLGTNCTSLTCYPLIRIEKYCPGERPSPP